MIQTTVSIALPTYEVSASLWETLDSIYAQTAYKRLKEIIIIVDGNPLTTIARRKLKLPKVRLIVKKKRQGQAARLNDIFSNCTSSLLVLTNDDVLLDKDALAKFLKVFDQDHPDLLTAKAQPLPAKNWLQHLLAIGSDMTQQLVHIWDNQQNYLACNGRLIGLSRAAYQDLHIPPSLWNNDAYIYWYVKTKNLVHRHVEQAVVRYQLPANLSEYARQSHKFKQSLSENKHFFVEKISQWYTIPKPVALSVLVRELETRPFMLLGYLALNYYISLWEIARPLKKVGYWETDVTTKQIG